MMSAERFDILLNTEKLLADERGKVARLQNQLRIARANALVTEDSIARLKSKHRELMQRSAGLTECKRSLERERDELRRKYNAVQSVHNPAVRTVRETVEGQ